MSLSFFFSFSLMVLMVSGSHQTYLRRNQFVSTYKQALMARKNIRVETTKCGQRQHRHHTKPTTPTTVAGVVGVLHSKKKLICAKQIK